jgi:hypothetical protein
MMKEVVSLASGSRRKLPSREEVEVMLTDLLEGRISRQDASTWATEFLVDDALDITDDRLLVALEQLAGADLMNPPDAQFPYQFGPEDFKNWLAKLLQ